ncbi:MAG TPA: hypothetical protein VGQ94_01520 [Terriglobales bacterium]|jgi:hypothetical protein|nr:hypothetical protein [Terriglobales bacterium]
MKNLFRIVTATLLLAACVAAAAPATTKAQMGLQEGPSPVPLCDPRNPKCPMPVSPTAPAQK